MQLFCGTSDKPFEIKCKHVLIFKYGGIGLEKIKWKFKSIVSINIRIRFVSDPYQNYKGMEFG